MQYCSPPSTMLAWGELFPVIGGAYSTFFPRRGSPCRRIIYISLTPPLADLAMGRYFSNFALPIPNFLPPPHSIAERGHSSYERGFAISSPCFCFPWLSTERGWGLVLPLQARPMIGLPGLAGLQGSRCPFPGPTGIWPWSPPRPCAWGCGCPLGAAGCWPRCCCCSAALRAEARTPSGGGARLAARPSRGLSRPGRYALPGAPSMRRAHRGSC
jgi:hypothetical protein